MKKLSLVTILLASCIAGTTNAAISLNKALASSKFTHAASKQEAQGINFTGTWEGRCEDYDGIDKLNITHLDDSLGINNQFFWIDGLNNKSSAMNSQADFEHMSLLWNKNKTILTGHMTAGGLGSDNGEMTTFTASSSSFSMSMMNGELIIKGGDIIEIENNHAKVVEKIANCVYKKVA